MHSRTPITYQNLPLEKFYPHVSARISRATSRGEVYCLIADHYPDLTADVLRAIAYAQPGVVLIPCHSGKDRTGTIAALALRIAGVAAFEVVRDYALSQERLLAAGDSNPVQENEKAHDDFWSRPTAGSEMMTMLLDHLDMAYGSVPGYLTHAGLAPVDMNALKARLLSA